MTLRSHVQVRGADWSLAEALDVSPASAGSLNLERLRLPAPPVGPGQRWQPAQLERLIRARATHGLPEFVWTGAEHVLVTRQEQVLAGTEFLQVALAAWAEAAGTPTPLQAEPVREVADVEVPAGAYRLRARRVANPKQAQAVVWIDVVVGERVVRTVCVSLRSQARQMVYVAKRSLSPGETAELDDFTRTEVSGVFVEPVPPVLTSHPFRLRRAVRRGEILEAGALEPDGGVRPGDPLRVMVRAGALRLEVNGVAAGEAVPGQMLTVHVGKGRDAMRGRLLDDGKVALE
jgi:flagella basal body P-ring formation protein FlgA